MNHVIAGQYYPVDSVMHRLDPRTKLIALFFYYIMLFLSRDIYAYFFAVVLCAVSMALTKVPLKIYFRSVRILLIFIVLAAIFAMFFTAGTALLQVGIFKVTQEGIAVAGTMAARLMLILFSALVLTFTTTPLSVTVGLERLFSPLRKIGVPVSEVTMMMSIAIRFIPVMLSEAETTLHAQQSRGADLYSGSLVQRGKNLLPLLLPLFVGAFRRAEELANAMEARGYRSDVSRSTFRMLRYGVKDIAVIVAFLLFLVLIIAYRWFL
jgi:energy-coupling factor transport system permease protein